MWTNMNVASRLDAAETAIGKLSSLIEDLIGETTALQNQVGAIPWVLAIFSYREPDFHHFSLAPLAAENVNLH